MQPDKRALDVLRGDHVLNERELISTVRVGARQNNVRADGQLVKIKLDVVSCNASKWSKHPLSQSSVKDVAKASEGIRPNRAVVQAILVQRARSVEERTVPTGRVDADLAELNGASSKRHLNTRASACAQAGTKDIWHSCVRKALAQANAQELASGSKQQNIRTRNDRFFGQLETESLAASSWIQQREAQQTG